MASRVAATLLRLAVVSWLALSLSSCGSDNPLTGLTITPGQASIALGQTQQFTAMAHYKNGSTKDVTASATWSSSTMTVATVSRAGLATSVGAGSTDIDVTFRQGDVTEETAATLTVQ